MADHFHKFAKMVARSFQKLSKTPHVFVAAVDGDALWKAYLGAFPAGTNPLVKKNTEHDCSCCRHFVRRAGNVVAVGENKVVTTVWDEAAEHADFPYDVVAKRLRGLVVEAGISDLYRVSAKEGSFGAEWTHSLDKETQRAATWASVW